MKCLCSRWWCGESLAVWILEGLNWPWCYSDLSLAAPAVWETTCYRLLSTQSRLCIDSLLASVKWGPELESHLSVYNQKPSMTFKCQVVWYILCSSVLQWDVHRNKLHASHPHVLFACQKDTSNVSPFLHPSQDQPWHCKHLMSLTTPFPEMLLSARTSRMKFSTTFPGAHKSQKEPLVTGEKKQSYIFPWFGPVHGVCQVPDFNDDFQEVLGCRLGLFSSFCQFLLVSYVLQAMFFKSH